MSHSTLTHTQQTMLGKLLERRGFTAPPLPLPPTHFVVQRKQDVSETSSSKLVVFYANPTPMAKGGVSVVRTLSQFLQERAVSVAILLCDAVTTGANAMLFEMRTRREPRQYVTPLSPKMLQYDIFDHVCVPHHRLLSPKEACSVLVERNLKLEMLPIIFTHDPMCLYFGGLPGDVFEIIRNRPNVGFHTYYRRVEDAP